MTTTEPIAVRTSTDLAEVYLDDLRFRNYSPGTIDNRARLLHRFGDHLAAPIDEATAGDVLAFLRRPMQVAGHRDATGRARERTGSASRGPNSVASERAGLASFFKFVVQSGLRPDNPCDRVPRPKIARRLPRPISEEDLTRAIAAAPKRVRPMLYLAAFAGLRACEIAGLRAEDVDLEANPPSLNIARQKGGDQSSVPISPIVAAVLSELPRKGWLFPKADGSGPLKAHSVSHLANDHLHAQGIWDTLHSLRHRFGTQTYRASGRDIRATQELMRHRTITSTQLYTATDRHEAAATVSALPGAGQVIR